MKNMALYLQIKDLLLATYTDSNSPLNPKQIKTLAMMITGMLLGPHIQLFAIAMCVPLAIKLPSIVRRFERFVADPQINVEQCFAPFVRAMINALGNETAYLIIDCTKVGSKCRVLFIGLYYHGTVLPLIWETVKGKKGHVTAELQRKLLNKIYKRFRYHRQVIVLGDAEFSNGPVIKQLKEQNWGFVFRFQSNYLIQLDDDRQLSAEKIGQMDGIQAGQVSHWEEITFTASHQISRLTMTIHWDEGAQEPLYLISNLPVSYQPHVLYEMRYAVETLFGNQKARGFQLARTHMITPAHIDRLMLALAIATSLTLGLGTHLIVSGQSNQVDRADRRDLSLFQLGWRWLYRLLALNRLHELKFIFRWDFQLPPPGYQPAI